MDHVLGPWIGTLTLINLLSICACLNGHRGFQALSSDAALYPVFRSAPSPQCGRHIMSSRAETAGLAPLRAKSGWIIALGGVYIVAGFLTFENPLLAAALLTLLLGFALVASGIMRIVLALSMKQEMPWIWVAASGVITLLLGLIILVHWPVSGLYILGLFLGIDLIIAGMGWIG